MRANREVADSAVLVLAILASAFAFSRVGAQAKDEPKGACPICGGDAAGFENSPEGVYRKFQAAFVAGDVAMAKECVTSGNETTWEGFREVQGSQGLALLARMRLVGCKTDGDDSTLTVAYLGDKPAIDLQARRVDGAWRLDLGDDEWLMPLTARLMATWAPEMVKRLDEARGRAKSRDCINNLRQLGTYTVMYVSKYGSDRDYSGPGTRLFTDLFNLPTQKEAIARGNHGLLLCKANGDTWNEEREAALKNDDPACMSYECIDVKISEGTTQPQWPIAWDKKPHPDGKRNVLFFSGSASEMTEEEFQQALQEWPHLRK